MRVNYKTHRYHYHHHILHTQIDRGSLLSPSKLFELLVTIIVIKSFITLLIPSFHTKKFPFQTTEA
jgi:hypothetical protein